MPIDLASDARQGQPFALPWGAGGTGRTDGKAYGLIVSARAIVPGGSLFDGDVVRIRVGGAGNLPDVEPSAKSREPVFGVVIDPTFVGVPHNQYASILVAGWHPRVKAAGSVAKGNYLIASGTSRSAAAISIPTTPNVFARATSPDASGYCAAVILAQPLFVGVHSQLGNAASLLRHLNITDAAMLLATNGVGDPTASTDYDESTATLLRLNEYIGFDAGIPVRVSGLQILGGRAAQRTGRIQLLGTNDSTWTSSTLVYDSGVDGWEFGTLTIPIWTTKYFGASAAFRYWRLFMPTNDNHNIYEWRPFEAAEVYFPAFGDSLLRRVAAAADALRDLSYQVVASNPSTGLVKVTSLGDLGENIVTGCDLTFGGATYLRVAWDIWLSQSNISNPKGMTIRVRKGGLTGTILYEKTGIGEDSDSTAGHHYHFAGDYLDPSPGSGRYVMTVQAEHTEEIWSDQRTMTLERMEAASAPSIPASLAANEIQVGFDGGTNDIVAGKIQDVRVPVDGTITGWHMFGDAAGSAVVNVWKDVEANYPPDVADTITAGNDPTLSAADHASDATLTGWTTSFIGGTVFRFKLASATGLKRLLLVLTYDKT